MSDAPKKHLGGQSIMRSYLMSKESLDMLEEIKARTGLSHSDAVRRSVVLLHGYLILDKLPEKK